MRRIGGYSLSTRLASGDLGNVFLGRRTHEPDAPERAVKVIRPELLSDLRFARLLMTEAPSAQQFRHPAAVEVHEVARVNDEAYVTMQLLGGQPFGAVAQRARIENEPLSHRLIAWIGAQVASALVVAHRTPWFTGAPAPLVHGSVAPKSIFITYSGQVRLLGVGFGRARQVVPPSASRLPYLPPELLQGRDLTPRADVYGLALVLYEAFTGRSLFRRASNEATRLAVQQANVPRLNARNLDVNPDIGDLLAEMMAPRPAARPESLDFAEASLRAAADGEDEAFERSLAAVMGARFQEEHEAFQRQVAVVHRQPPSALSSAVVSGTGPVAGASSPSTASAPAVAPHLPLLTDTAVPWDEEDPSPYEPEMPRPDPWGDDATIPRGASSGEPIADALPSGTVPAEASPSVPILPPEFLPPEVPLAGPVDEDGPRSARVPGAAQMVGAAAAGRADGPGERWESISLPDPTSQPTPDPRTDSTADSKTHSTAGPGVESATAGGGQAARPNGTALGVHSATVAGAGGVDLSAAGADVGGGVGADDDPMPDLLPASAGLSEALGFSARTATGRLSGSSGRFPVGGRSTGNSEPEEPDDHDEPSLEAELEASLLDADPTPREGTLDADLAMTSPDLSEAVARARREAVDQPLSLALDDAPDMVGDDLADEDVTMQSAADVGTTAPSSSAVNGDSAADDDDDGSSFSLPAAPTLPLDRGQSAPTTEPEGDAVPPSNQTIPALPLAALLDDARMPFVAPPPPAEPPASAVAAGTLAASDLRLPDGPTPRSGLGTKSPFAEFDDEPRRARRPSLPRPMSGWSSAPLTAGIDELDGIDERRGEAGTGANASGGGKVGSAVVASPDPASPPPESTLEAPSMRALGSTPEAAIKAGGFGGTGGSAMAGPEPASGADDGAVQSSDRDEGASPENSQSGHRPGEWGSDGPGLSDGPPTVEEPSPASLQAELEARRAQAGIPSRVGRYHIKSALAQVRGTWVLTGWDPNLSRAVRIHLLDPRRGWDPHQGPDQRVARFKVAARRWSTLRHSTLPTLLDAGRDGQLYFLVFEGPIGAPLTELVTGPQPMPVGQVRSLMLEMVEGLRYLHGRGLVLGHVRAASVVVGPQGCRFVDLTHLGESGEVGAPPRPLLAQAPENLAGAPYDHRSEQFALGALFYQMLVGQRPFDGLDDQALAAAIRHRGIRTPKERSPDADNRLSRACMKMLAAQPDERYADLGAVLSVLKGHRPADQDTEPVISTPRAPPSSRSVVIIEPSLTPETTEAVLRNAGLNAAAFRTWAEAERHLDGLHPNLLVLSSAAGMTTPPDRTNAEWRIVPPAAARLIGPPLATDGLVERLAALAGRSLGVAPAPSGPPEGWASRLARQVCLRLGLGYETALRVSVAMAFRQMQHRLRLSPNDIADLVPVEARRLFRFRPQPGLPGPPAAQILWAVETFFTEMQSGPAGGRRPGKVLQMLRTRVGTELDGAVMEAMVAQLRELYPELDVPAPGQDTSRVMLAGIGERPELVEALEREGFDVDSADDGHEVWAHLRAKPYHVVVMHAGLEGRDAASLLRLTRNHPETRGVAFLVLADEPSDALHRSIEAAPPAEWMALTSPLEALRVRIVRLMKDGGTD